jgi:hypothetical protein
MVVAAAILAFALRADLSTAYKAALDELVALKQTAFENWGSSITDRYKDYENQNDEFVSDIVERESLPLQGNPKLNEPVFGDTPAYKENATLLQLDAFISGSLASDRLNGYACVVLSGPPAPSTRTKLSPKKLTDPSAL